MSFSKNSLPIISHKNDGFLQLFQKRRITGSRGHQNRIPRQILGRGTFNFNQIRYKLIFEGHFDVFGRFDLLFYSGKWKKLLLLSRKVF